MGVEQVLKRIPRIKFPQRHPKPSASGHSSFFFLIIYFVFFGFIVSSLVFNVFLMLASWNFLFLRLCSKISNLVIIIHLKISSIREFLDHLIDLMISSIILAFLLNSNRGTRLVLCCFGMWEIHGELQMLDLVYTELDYVVFFFHFFFFFVFGSFHFYDLLLWKEPLRIEMDIC